MHLNPQSEGFAPRCFLVIMKFVENEDVGRVPKFYMSEKCGVFIEKGLTLKPAALANT